MLGVSIAPITFGSQIGHIAPWGKCFFQDFRQCITISRFKVCRYCQASSFRVSYWILLSIVNKVCNQMLEISFLLFLFCERLVDSLQQILFAVLTSFETILFKWKGKSSSYDDTTQNVQSDPNFEISR